MELLEYIMFNFGQQSEKSVELLSNLCDIIKEKLTEEEYIQLVKALYLSKGYTEYRVKEIANELGFTKTKVKYLVKQLIEENKIELVTVENVTFIKPVF